MNISSYNNNSDEDINFTELFVALWNKKYLILSFTSVAAIISVIYALSLPNVYVSTALLAPSNSENQMNSSMGGLSSLAGMAGIKLGSESGGKTQEAIARMKSYDFFIDQFLPNIKYEDLVSAKNWDPATNKVIYDPKIKDSNYLKPSHQEAFLIYSSIFNVVDDRDTAFINLSLEHVSPNIAKLWLDLIIAKINSYMRELDKSLAESSINYLKLQAKETTLSGVKGVIFQLIEDQIQILTLAEVNENYAFKQLVSPIAAEKKSSPARSMICIVGTIVGFLIGIFMSLLLHFFKKEKENFVAR